MPVTFIPVGGYATIAVSGSFANLKTRVDQELDKAILLIPNPDAATAPSAGVAGASPYYDAFPPALARFMRAELAALKAVIAAAT